MAAISAGGVFEARVSQGALIKKLVDAMKELITDANLDVATTGITLQAMDSSHVSLCSMLLRCDGFEHYRCDRAVSLGVSLKSLATILKCANNEDTITLRHGSGGSKAEGDSDAAADTLQMVFENASQDRISDFEMKLMDIDAEHLGIPETEYKCIVKMPSAEFRRICSDLSQMGDTCTIGISKDGVKFSVSGDIGNANTILRSNTSADKEDEHVVIEMDEPVELTFAMRYLNFFCKAAPLSPTVSLSLSKEVPLVVEFPIEGYGHIRYYLAPKIDDDEDE